MTRRALNNVLLGIFVLLIQIPGFSQPVAPYMARCRVAYRLPYRPGDNGRFRNGNTILVEMAKEVLREPWLVRIAFTCDLEFVIVREGDRSRLSVTPQRLAVSNDTLYRNFSVAGVLAPPDLSLKLKWANRADTSAFTEQLVRTMSLLPADSMQRSMPVALFDPMVDTLMARDAEFSYDSVAFHSFMARISLIHDYYASLALLDSLQRMVSGIIADDKPLLPLNYLKAEEISRALERIGARDFPGSLLQDGHDPGSLMKKYQDVLRQSRTLSFNYLDALKMTGAIPWDGDLCRLSDYFASRALSYVRRSFLMDREQGLIYGDCLDHFFDPTAFSTGEDVPSALLAKMFPGAALDTIPRFLARQIYGSYRSLSLRLIGENRFADARALLENGRRFLASMPSATGIAPDEALESRAAAGIFDSYLGIASSCLETGKLSMAESYLEKARQYSLAHPGPAGSDTAYRRLFSRLFFLRNGNCDRLLEQKRFSDALACYGHIEKDFPPEALALVSSQLEEKKTLARSGMEYLSSSLAEDALKRRDNDTALYYYDLAKRLRDEQKTTPVANVRLDSLAPVMAKVRFSRLSADAEAALEKRQFTLAVTQFREADSIALANNIGRSREFDSLYRRAMKHSLVIQLSNAQRKIWVSQFDSARAALDKVILEGAGSGVEQDPDFVYALDHFRMKIREQQCRNLGDSVDLRVIRADRSNALRNYTGAMASLNEAIEIIRLTPECGITAQPLLDTIVKYTPPATYQQKLAHIRSMAAAGNFPDAVRELDENQQAFQEQNLGRFGIQPEGVYDFIRDRQNPYLTEKAVAYYIEKEDYKEAVRLLVLSQEQGLPSRATAAMQKHLGINFSQEDFRKEQQNDPVKNVAKYIPAEAWFDAFRKSYLDEWKRLEKAAGRVGSQ